MQVVSGFVDGCWASHNQGVSLIPWHSQGFILRTRSFLWHAIRLRLWIQSRNLALLCFVNGANLLTSATGNHSMILCCLHFFCGSAYNVQKFYKDIPNLGSLAEEEE